MRHWRVTISSFNMISAWWSSTTTRQHPLFPMVMKITIHGRISPKGGEMMWSIPRPSPGMSHHHRKDREDRRQEHTRVPSKPSELFPLRVSFGFQRESDSTSKRHVIHSQVPPRSSRGSMEESPSPSGDPRRRRGRRT